MRAAGGWLMGLGFLGALSALFMDVSVETAMGRVNNIGLISDRQNYLIVAGLMILVGVILIVADKSPTTPNPKKVAAEPLPFGITEEDGLFVWDGQPFPSFAEAESHVAKRLADHKAKSTAAL